MVNSRQIKRDVLFNNTSLFSFICKSLLFIGLIFVWDVKTVFASSIQAYIDLAKSKDLGNSSTWLHLLHYEGGQSVIIKDNFFLSPDGDKSPEAELTETISAYFLPWVGDLNEHPRCRYPARYYWLNNQIGLPEYKVDDDRCGRFSRWALYNKVKSISVLLVSGYFGNPASTFGHTILRFNTESMDDQKGLFDLTLSYGAVVPENENGVAYVVRGLFGGYKAGYSDKYFYTHDQVYAGTEYRDVWDYKLNLTESQRRFLILHIWEIVGHKFNYYFLDKNCAFRLGDLLELATDSKLVKPKFFWYLPVELFYQLESNDLISSISYLPSNQRRMFYHLKLLSNEDLKIFNQIIKDGKDSISNHLSDLPMIRQIYILDALLEYHQYRMTAEEPKSADNDKNYTQRKEFKDRVLLERLRKPILDKQEVKIKHLESPAQGSKPMTFSMGIATSRDYSKLFLRLGLSPFKNENIGKNSLEGDEFVILDTALGVLEKDKKVFFDKLDIIKILKLNTLSSNVIGENQLSWKVYAGINRVKTVDEGNYDGKGIFGLGYARALNDSQVLFGLTDLSAHTTYPYIRLKPYLGTRFDWGNLKMTLIAGAQSTRYDGSFREIWSVKSQYQINSRLALQAEFTNESYTQSYLGFNWFW